MKRIFLFICIISLLSGCSSKKIEKNEDKPTEPLALELLKKEECQNEVTEYYKDNNRKIFFVCLKEVMVSKENSTLSYYFNQNNKSFAEKINEIKSTLKEVETLKDGGAKLYQNDFMTLIECNHIIKDQNNKDIYIGDENLTFQENFCTSENQ